MISIIIECILVLLENPATWNLRCEYTSKTGMSLSLNGEVPISIVLRSWEIFVDDEFGVALFLPRYA